VALLLGHFGLELFLLLDVFGLVIAHLVENFVLEIECLVLVVANLFAVCTLQVVFILVQIRPRKTQVDDHQALELQHVLVVRVCLDLERLFQHVISVLNLVNI